MSGSAPSMNQLAGTPTSPLKAPAPSKLSLVESVNFCFIERCPFLVIFMALALFAQQLKPLFYFAWSQKKIYSIVKSNHNF